jgi:hypothetical protein
MQSLRCMVAVTFAAEIGDVHRVDTPRQLMSFLGLVPAESSAGDTVRRKGLTLAGNRRARRVVEAAWTYRYPARVSGTLRARIEGLRSRCAISPGKPSSDSVPGIVGSVLPATSALARQAFEHTSKRIVFQEGVDAIEVPVSDDHHRWRAGRHAVRTKAPDGLRLKRQA